MIPPLRISFVCHEFPPFGGGAASALERLTRVLATRGHQVQVLTVGDGTLPPVEQAGGRVVQRLGTPRRTLLAPSIGELLRSYLTLRRQVRQPIQAFAPHLLVAYFAFPAGHALLPVARALGLPLLVSLRGSDVPGFHRRRWGGLAPLLTRLTLPVLRQADLVLANGTHLQGLARQLLPSLRVENLPNGIDPFPLPTPFPPSRPPRLLFVGQLIERKRCRLMVEALAWLGQAGGSVEATFAGDGPLRQTLQEMGDRLPAGITLRLAGHQPRTAMPDLYREHDILLHLSQAEGVSNVLLEGLAAGLAVIASTEACDGSLADSRGIRRLADPTPARVGAAIADLLNDPQALAAMRLAALETARRLNWEQVAAAFEAHAVALLNKGNQPPTR